MKLMFIIIVSFTLLVACKNVPESKSGKAVDIASDRDITRVENGLRQTLQITGQEVAFFNIESRIEHHQIPGVSIAVAHNGELLWSKAYGFADISQSKKMTTNTMLLAGSISKPVAALRALQLHDEGRFLLDKNVNTYLSSWKVPDNEFTENEKVNLRRILNHSAGLTVWGFDGYDKDDDLPSTIEVLDGKGNSDPVRVYKTPGQSWQYSGGGYTIMQLAIADIEQQAFAEILQSKVLDPLNMSNSTFENPLPNRYHVLAATGYRSNGDEVEGKWPIYPEMAAAGLWTTPSQLVEYGIEIQRIIDTQQDGIISYNTALEMLTPGDTDHGLGPKVETHTFSHGGADEGFRAHFVAWRDSPYVAVVMVNSDNGAIINEILMSITNEYQLPGYEPRLRTIVELPNKALEKFVGSYDSGDDGVFEVSITEKGLSIFVVNFNYRSLLFSQSPVLFFEENNGRELEFIVEDDQPIKLLWRGREATRLVE
jgi:CubicO group peptidase (beta-lactamase class C family)